MHGLFDLMALNQHPQALKRAASLNDACQNVVPVVRFWLLPYISKADALREKRNAS